MKKAAGYKVQVGVRSKAKCVIVKEEIAGWRRRSASIQEML